MRNSTVYALLQNTSEQYGERPFLHIPAIACKNYHNGDIDISYQQMLAEVDKLSSQYRASGYGIGHRVAVLLDNRPDFFQHWFALNSLGVSLVPINGEMQPDEQAYLLSRSEACVLVCLPEKITAMKQVLAGMGDAAVPLVDSNGLNIPEAPVVMENSANMEGSMKSPADRTTEPCVTTECAMLFTSGSTGKPKGCILQNEYFLECGRWYRDLGGLCTLEPGVERLLTPLPLVHMNAMAVSGIGMLATGGCLIQLDRFHPSTWWNTVKESRATALHYLGVLPAILLSMPERDDDLNPQIKFGFGAGVNPEHHAAFEERFGFPLVEGWAMTESGVGGGITAYEEPRYVGTSCFGVPDPERVKVRVIDAQGEEVPAGQPGELLVRAAGDHPGRGFFSGYYKNPEATEEAWQGGWLHTGDTVLVGESGEMHFVDRLKNVIRRSGENIAALEVEATLVHSPVVEQVVVTAAADDIRGDEVLAFVIPKANTGVSETAAQAVFDCAMEHLVYYKAPGYVVFVDSLPLTASQKPQRAEIKKLAKRVLEENSREYSATAYDLRKQKRRVK